MGKMEQANRTVDRFAEWIRYGDAKAAGVLVVPALGLADLLNHGRQLSHAHSYESNWGLVASACFWLALILVVLVVGEVSRALFPKTRPTSESVLYFGTVAKLTNNEYRTTFNALTDAEMLTQLTNQAWELAGIAGTKFRRTKIAFWLALGFLAAWAVARLAFTLAS